MGIPFLDESRSFSLIFRGAKTLDLMVAEGGDREEILYVLTRIIEEYGIAKLKVGNEVLLLRYIWNDVDRVRKSFMGWFNYFNCDFLYLDVLIAQRSFGGNYRIGQL